MDIFRKLEEYEQVDGYYNSTQIDLFMASIDFGKTIKTNKKVEYFNIPCSFDIETTSFEEYKNGGYEKRTVMYEWTLCINWQIMIGRTWEELMIVLERISTDLGLWENRRLIIYVHNLSFEFQAFRKHFDWLKVFSLKERKPVQAITTDGIEFRCSYILSGYSLEKLSDQLTKYKVEKLVGGLDYSQLRHSETPLTEQELKYCINDVLVVCAYIQEKIERDGDITKLQLTKTGYVRKYCRDKCFYEDKTHRKNTDKFHNYHNLMKSLSLEPEEYVMLKDAFMGGFTHANPYFSTGVFHNVDSYDFTSSYPYVMISEKFPMSKGKLVKINSYEELYDLAKKYCLLIQISIVGLKPKITYENYLSSSHCKRLKNAVENNGRLVSADFLQTTITEQDYYIIEKFYSWDNIVIEKCYAYERAYLPKSFVESILKLYVDKTVLKGVKSMEVEYLVSKENVNSCFGMCVTDICKEEIVYNGTWGKEPPDINSIISKYNKSKRRFLSYAWGLWVTAYARRNLFTGIMEFGEDYIYSDTDSIKVVNADKHKIYFDRYNEVVRIKLKLAMNYHNLPFDMVAPKTIKGEVKMLGLWEHEKDKDDDHSYARFKTLGAKRYMTETPKGELSITVSGLNKVKAVPYIKSLGEDPFKFFDENMYIPPEYTGKLTHTYIDDEHSGVIIDYMGNELEYHELSGTHLKPCHYDLSIAQKYMEYILGLRDMEE